MIGLGANWQINAQSEDERRAASRCQAERRASGKLSLGAMPMLSVLAALGLVLVALGNNGAREGASELQPLFWGGLVLIYAPIALRLLSSTARREERIALVLTLGIALFVVKVLRSPLDYVRFDELGWWQATDEVVRTGHAFGDNPIAAATAGFPGLSTFTAAISQLTGLSIFHAGLVVIGTARAFLMLALFLFLERAAGSSPRVAGIGVAIYACNPSFLYFDAQFGYESLALMLGAALLLAALHWAGESRTSPVAGIGGLLGVLLVLTCVVTVTHHMTSFALLAFLLVWAAIVAVVRRRWPDRASARVRARGPALPAMLMAIAVTVWFVFVAGEVTIEELGGVFSRAFLSVFDLITGNSGPKQLFTGAGQNEHLIARALAIGSVIPLLILVPVGLLKTWKGHVRDPLRLALAAVAALYPLSLALRLTLASSETSQRASEFVFVGVGFVGAIVIAQWSWLGRRPAAIGRSAALAVIAVATFLGGFIIGELQATRQPGPYLVGAEDRSVTPQGLAAAEFAAEQLPPESRIHVDRTNATLLSSYGRANPIFGKFADISIPRLLFSKSFDEMNRRVIHGQSLAYLVVDTRLSKEVPLIGYYVESDEALAFTRQVPVSREALEKFRSVPTISRIYTNGPISIYDTSALLK